MDQAGAWLSKSVEDAGEGCICVEKRAGKGKHPYVKTGLGAVEQELSKQITQREKAKTAEDSQKHTAKDGGAYHIADPGSAAKCIKFSNRRHEHNGQGTGKGGGKKDHRQCHTCKNTISLKG